MAMWMMMIWMVLMNTMILIIKMDCQLPSVIGSIDGDHQEFSDDDDDVADNDDESNINDDDTVCKKDEDVVKEGDEVLTRS